MNLVNFARVGKRLLRSITGVQENYKTTEFVEENDYTACFSCELYKLSSSTEKTLYCSEYCNKIKIKKKKVKYINEANSFKIPVEERLSKLQLKQLILYHFLHIDGNGILKNISINDIANMLNCDRKTIINNNNRLVELNYILYSKICKDNFSVFVLDYKNYHLKKHEGGTGYVNISKELFYKLLNIQNVNALRLELRSLIEFDNNNMYSDNVTYGRFSFNDIKRLLPKYLRYEKAIEKTIKHSSGAFDVIVDEKGIEFKLKDKYNAKILKEDMLIELENAFDSYMHIFRFTNEELVDVYKMSLQYGIDVVKNALDVIISDYIEKGIEIRILGALIRMKIRVAS